MKGLQGVVGKDAASPTSNTSRREIFLQKAKGILRFFSDDFADNGRTANARGRRRTGRRVAGEFDRSARGELEAAPIAVLPGTG
jgi:hypothetical protein